MKSERNLQDDEDILASRTLEEMLDEADAIEAANPYGCNQHGHREGHQGGASSAAEKKAKQRIIGSCLRVIKNT